MLSRFILYKCERYVTVLSKKKKTIKASNENIIT